MRGYEAVKRLALSRAQPLTAMIELTYSCNWRCVFCYNPRHHDLRRLTLEEWCALLDDLRELGTLFITVTGGEPLAHPQFFEIAGEIKKRAFSLEIFTNGSLIDEETARRIAELQPAEVELSLHGATPDTHDMTTGKTGSFAALWRGVDHLLRQPVNVVLKSPVTKLNLLEVESMVSLAATRGLPLKLDGTITPKDDGDLSPLDYMVEPSQVESMMERLEASGQLPGRVEREREGVNCGLGRITLAVDPEGNVYPCLQWRRSALGNVRERRLTEMWHGSPVRLESAEAGDLANRKLFEVGGPVSAFPFCPALADQMAGDPTAITARHEVQAKVASLLRRDESQA